MFGLRFILMIAVGTPDAVVLQVLETSEETQPGDSWIGGDIEARGDKAWWASLVEGHPDLLTLGRGLYWVAGEAKVGGGAPSYNVTEYRKLVAETPDGRSVELSEHLFTRLTNLEPADERKH